jgi:hypothetical protein
MTSHQYEQSMKAVNYLRHGAPAHQKSALPGRFVGNSASTFKHGQIVTDNIATWIKERFAAGPFDYLPFVFKCAIFPISICAIFIHHRYF